MQYDCPPNSKNTRTNVNTSKGSISLADHHSNSYIPFSSLSRLYLSSLVSQYLSHKKFPPPITALILTTHQSNLFCSFLLPDYPQRTILFTTPIHSLRCLPKYRYARYFVSPDPLSDRFYLIVCFRTLTPTDYIIGVPLPSGL